MGKEISSRSWHPRIIAHRGGAAGAGLPENSEPAFLAASKAGFKSECDVWLSADGQPVVIHDQTLDRTTTAVGNVADLDSARLRKISLRNPAANAAAFLPMLEDVAPCIELVEIKPDNARLLIQRVIQIMAGKTWTLMSFDQSNLRHAREIDPSVNVAFLVRDPHEIDTAVSSRWPTNIDQKLLDQNIARRFRDAGLSLGAWTVDTQDQLHRLLPFQPDPIISNNPILIRQWLSQPPSSAS